MWLSAVLPETRTSFPCAATYSNVLRAVDAEQVTQVMNDLLIRVGTTKRCGEAPSRLLGPSEQPEAQVHLALDGKTLRGTLGHAAVDQKKMHQLALYETQTGVILKEQVTAEKQNELSIVSQFLTPLLVKGRILSADALHTEVAPSVGRSNAGRATMYSSPKAIKPPCWRTGGSFLRSPHPTAATGARHAPSTKAMDASKSAN